MASKQDLNGYRTPLDVARRYKLGNIEINTKEIEEIAKQMIYDDTLSITSTNAVQNKVITQTLNNKVNAIPGKGLSSNDFTDAYKNELDNLPTISSTDVSNWNAAYTDKHTHSNKTVLDGITAANIGNWNAAYTNSHSHSNKTVLDGISATEVSNWNSSLKPTIVYTNNSGSKANITLSSSIADAVCIDIIYGNSNSVYDTKRIYDPSGKNIALSITTNTSNSYEVKTENDTISNTAITRGTRNKIAIDSTGAVTFTADASITDADKILIYKVISYK